MAPNQVGDFLDKLAHNDVIVENQDIFRNHLDKEWDDLTQLIISEVENHE